MQNKIYKIKDSVDLFLSDNKYITAYFMNTRQRKTFKINEEMIHLFELIDGNNNVAAIKEAMFSNYDVSEDSVNAVLNMLYEKRIITDVVKIDNQISEEDYKRYTRQINYFSEFLDSEESGINAQKKVMNSHVGIFGCGAVGGDIALQLVMAGVGKITLFDMDDVEASDASRHMYFKNDNIGKPKVDSLKEELMAINSNVIINCIKSSMKPTDDIEKFLIGMDFVVNTLDEPYIGYTSSKISRVCIKHKIPHFIAGGFDAHLASTGEIIIPYVTPCVECYATHFKESLKDWKPRKHPVKTRDMEIGGLSSMTLFSSSYAAIEILKYLAGIIEMNDEYKVRGELLFTDLKITYLNVTKNPECPVCGGTNKL